MDKNSILDEIFANDPFNILDVKPAASPALNEDGRLIASFLEINNFYHKNKREPEQGKGIQEYQLFSRLRSIRENPSKADMLKPHDKYGLLHYEQKSIETFDDIFNDDSLGLLDDEASDLFNLKHITKVEERASADFVARRKACKDFSQFEPIFKDVQQDLAKGKRRFIPFKEDNLREGDFYVHNGILLLLDKVDFEEGVQEFKSGPRVRKDGRTRVVFENGTESNMLYRSLYKSLLINGKAISENTDKVNEAFQKKFSDITEEDEEKGYIYILKSRSDKPEIKSIKNLYKIGYSKTSVEERVKNAVLEPTYLMADVRIVMTYKCYNMNPQKFEQLLHNFFGSSCLNIDIFDKNGNRHSPREWFVAPLDIIEQAVQLIITGDIVKYRYDSVSEQCMQL